MRSLFAPEQIESHLPAAPSKKTKEPRIRSLVSYYGGKKRMSSKIVPLLPQHTVYVEPFAGGAAVLFAKPIPPITNSDHYREVINDTFGELTAMYAFARDHSEKFKEMLAMTPFSAGTYALAKRISVSKNVSVDQSAWATYVLLQQSFSYSYKGGWARGVCGPNLADLNLTRNRDIQSSIDRLRNVYIEEKDALDCMKTWDSPQTLFYCDPPYINTQCRHYSGFSSEDYQRLICALDELEGSFVLSCYDAPGIHIPDNWERFSFDSHCSAAGTGNVGKSRLNRHGPSPTYSKAKRKRTEIVYRRFNRVAWRQDLEKVRLRGVYDCFARS